MKNIELLEKAQAGKEIKVEVVLIEGDEPLIGVFSSPDMLAMNRQRVFTFAEELEACSKFKGKPFDEIEWNNGIKAHIKDLKETTDKPQDEIDKIEARMRKDKPADYAHQVAEELTKSRVVLELIPSHIRGLDDKLLFNSPDEQERFKSLLAKDIKLYVKVVQAYSDLFAKVNEIEEDVKN